MRLKKIRWTKKGQGKRGRKVRNRCNVRERRRKKRRKRRRSKRVMKVEGREEV